MTLERRSRARHEGGYKLYYRLSTRLYPQADEPYAVVPSNLIYGGAWALLPNPALRHLYLVIAGLDPIGDEEAYLDRIAEDLDGDWDRRADDDDEAIIDPAERAAAIQAKILAAQRACHPCRYATWWSTPGFNPVRWSKPCMGFWPRYLATGSMRGWKTHPLPCSNRVAAGRTTDLVSPDRRAWTWSVKCEVMNSPCGFK